MYQDLKKKSEEKNLEKTRYSVSEFSLFQQNFTPK